jgi:hypothetical protein
VKAVEVHYKDLIDLQENICKSFLQLSVFHQKMFHPFMDVWNLNKVWNLRSRRWRSTMSEDFAFSKQHLTSALPKETTAKNNLGAITF